MSRQARSPLPTKNQHACRPSKASRAASSHRHATDSRLQSSAARIPCPRCSRKCDQVGAALHRAGQEDLSPQMHGVELPRPGIGLTPRSSNRSTGRQVLSLDTPSFFGPPLRLPSAGCGRDHETNATSQLWFMRLAGEECGGFAGCRVDCAGRVGYRQSPQTISPEPLRPFLMLTFRDPTIRPTRVPSRGGTVVGRPRHGWIGRVRGSSFRP